MTTPKKPKIFVLAGEASGDLHGSHVVRKLVTGEGISPCDVVCWGGDLMAQAGGRLLSHYKDRAIMGLWEVIRNLKKISRFMDQAKADILKEQPDLLLLIDNPGFNLRIAQWAKAKGIAVHYYIAPKAWAWNTGRIKTMRKVIDQLYVIFPFEVSFFAKYQMPSTYVGNPILEAIDQSLQRFHEQRGWDVDLTKEFGVSMDTKDLDGSERRLNTIGDEASETVLLMPGSRKNEVKGLLPNFVAAARRYNPQAHCVVAGAPGLELSFYQETLKDSVLSGGLSQADADAVTVYFGATYHLLMQLGDGALLNGIQSVWRNRGVALVASGTATLETALLGVPQVVAYKVNGFTFMMAKWLVKLRWVSLVNILLDRPLLEEHLQDVSPLRLSVALKGLHDRQREMFAGYESLRAMLQNSEGLSASDGVVRGIADKVG